MREENAGLKVSYFRENLEVLTEFRNYDRIGRCVLNCEILRSIWISNLREKKKCVGDTAFTSVPSL